MNDFAQFFCKLTGKDAPHHWQNDLGACCTAQNRLIRIPTGFGKTHGVLAAWAYNRLERQDPSWPRRLVWCLPMRTLVEQTEAEIKTCLSTAGLLWDGHSDTHAGTVGVHVLMGGSDAGDWHLYPEENAVLIGTQDMLLSRALNRGYAAPRARWPMEFGLLNQDALWIADEVQLMDVGLATSAQMQQFRTEDHVMSLRPCFSWWMSATLQPDWLASVDTSAMVTELQSRTLSISPEQRTGPLWGSVTKPLQMIGAVDGVALAKLTLEKHLALADSGHGRITLVVRNHVEHAVEVYEALLSQGRTSTNTRLIHSRFRGEERKTWRIDFLSRAACCQSADLIIVATQVVEAGVDISAGCLITDLAPWPSLVQRFGRAARYGGHADIVVLAPAVIDDKVALPYDAVELTAARETLSRLTDVSQKSLEAFESGLTETERQRLYPYEPRNLLLRKELDELFDTTPDLTGADLDISRFIRSGKEHDCQVFWADWTDDLPPDTLQPHRDGLCAVPFYSVQKWLFGSKEQLKDDLKAKVFVWDYLNDAWQPPKPKDIYPGRLILAHTSIGGYNVYTGFIGEKPNKKSTAVPAVVAAPATRDVQSDLGADNDSLSEAEQYQTIAAHGAAVASATGALASALGLPTGLTALLVAAARYHDLGKVHPAFRRQIIPSVASGMQDTPDLAKAPQAAWTGPRPHGFRHELASALALMELLARADQLHPALLGACHDLLACHVLLPEPAPATPLPASLGDELRALTPEQFNLLVYLVCAHHGKVRAALHACPADQDAAADDEAGMPIRGIKDGDPLPPVRIMDAHGEAQTVSGLDLHLAPAMLGLSGRYGPSWRERTLALQSQHSPFALALLETLLRAADVRVSREVQS